MLGGLEEKLWLHKLETSSNKDALRLARKLLLKAGFEVTTREHLQKLNNSIQDIELLKKKMQTIDIDLKNSNFMTDPIISKRLEELTNEQKERIAFYDSESKNQMRNAVNTLNELEEKFKKNEELRKKYESSH